MKNLTKDQEVILELSNRMVKAQQPIRVLDAIKWDDSIKQDFFANRYKKLPAVQQEYYSALPFSAREKRLEFIGIENDIKNRLGDQSAVSKMMTRICREYRDVVQMLECRGTDEFCQISKNLYGSSDDSLYPGSPTLQDLSGIINRALNKISIQTESAADKKKYSADEAAKILHDRLSTYFGHNTPIDVVASDAMVADAAAGADVIRLNAQMKFSPRDIRLYEVHEGWVHLGTTFNGMRQPICTFLGKGPASSSVTQEGLAMLLEIVTFSSYPDRVRRINNRVIGITMAEQGANFLDVFRYFQESGLDDEKSYHNTVRIFRGSTPCGGPYTKDLSYSKGFVLIYNYLRLAIQAGSLSKIPLLFVGKINLNEIQLLSEMLEVGIIQAPEFVPEPFSDLAALSSWMSYSLFMNKIDLNKLAENFNF